MEVNELIQFITTYKGVLLKEERGVGASREWLDVVKEVTDYVADVVMYGDRGFDNKWHINVPKHITKKFEIFSDLRIEVTVEDKGFDAENYSGGGAVISFAFPETVVDKLEQSDKPIYTYPVTMEIDGYSDDNLLIRKTVANALIHELNHKLDEYYRTTVSKKDVGYVYKQTGAYEALHPGVFKDVVYRLFSESELNALIASVYGDLEGINSKRQNFNQDINNLTAYWEYVDLKRIINAIEKKATVQNWESMIEYFKHYSVLSPLPNRQNNVTPERMKQAFLKKARKELDNLLRGIGRVASYYYDMHEESKTRIMTKNKGGLVK